MHKSMSESTACSDIASHKLLPITIHLPLSAMSTNILGLASVIKILPSYFLAPFISTGQDAHSN